MMRHYSGAPYHVCVIKQCWVDKEKIRLLSIIHAANLFGQYKVLVGFGRACATVSCALPSFWAHCHAQWGAACPSAHCSFAAPYLSYTVPSEISCILLSYAAPFWATLHPIWAKLRPKSYAAPSELSCALLSYAAPFWATLHPTELRLTLNELRSTLIYSLSK